MCWSTYKFTRKELNPFNNEKDNFSSFLIPVTDMMGQQNILAKSKTPEIHEVRLYSYRYRCQF